MPRNPDTVPMFTRIPKSLDSQVKKRAKHERRTVTAFVTAALKAALKKDPESTEGDSTRG